MHRATVKDLDAINNWRKDRLLNLWDERDMPEYGIVEPEKAACFLVKTDTRYAFLEGLIANRKASVTVRHEALFICIGACVKKAKDLGFQKLLFLTDHESVSRYGVEFGFEFVKAYNLYEKEI